MKKIMAMTILFLLVLTACSSASKPAAEPEPAASQEPANQQTATTAPAAAASEPTLPANTYKIAASDMADPITMKYKIDPEDEGMIKTATFDIRNFGDRALKPIVIFYVGSESGSDVKRFEYAEIPPGYKMIVTESINMAVFGLHEMNAIKADLRDGNQNEKKIGESAHTYIAKPSYDSSP